MGYLRGGAISFYRPNLRGSYTKGPKTYVGPLSATNAKLAALKRQVNRQKPKVSTYQSSKDHQHSSPSSVQTDWNNFGELSADLPFFRSIITGNDFRNHYVTVNLALPATIQSGRLIAYVPYQSDDVYSTTNTFKGMTNIPNPARYRVLKMVNFSRNYGSEERHLTFKIPVKNIVTHGSTATNVTGEALTLRKNPIRFHLHTISNGAADVTINTLYGVSDN